MKKRHEGSIADSSDKNTATVSARLPQDIVDMLQQYAAGTPNRAQTSVTNALIFLVRRGWKSLPPEEQDEQREP